MVLTTIGIKIKELREKKELTPESLAEDLNFTKSIIWSYELNKKEPSISHLLRLADYFEVSIDYLLSRKEPLTVLDLKVPINDILNEYIFRVDGEVVNENELEEAIAYIKAKRILKREKI